MLHGSPGSLDTPHSPYRLHFLWFFQPITSLAGRNFQGEGYEVVEGRSCAKFLIDMYEGLSGPDARTVRFWIDLERGGHPLRVETYDGGRLLTRAHSIELEQVGTTNGVPLHFPVRGVFESFRWGKDYHDDPIFREEIRFVATTFRLNQGLSDQVFTARWNGQPLTAGSDNPLRREYIAESAKTRARRPRTDAATVQAELVAHLVEAEKQAEMLEASSPAQIDRNRAWIWQVGLVVVGLGLVVGAGAWVWRQRR